MAEAILAARGIDVSHQTVRILADKYGGNFANETHRRFAGKLGEKWHIDEGFFSIGDRKYWLWRAVDQESFSNDEVIQHAS